MGFVRRDARGSLKPLLGRAEEARTAEKVLEWFRGFCERLGGRVERTGYYVGESFYTCSLPEAKPLRLEVDQRPKHVGVRKVELVPHEIGVRLYEPRPGGASFVDWPVAVRVEFRDEKGNRVEHTITAASTLNTLRADVRVKEVTLGLHPVHPDRYTLRFTLSQ